ncbi:MAG: protein kinase [Myxococcales bacterium]|nr:protein kinase [Myxococcales bacterium]
MANPEPPVVYGKYQLLEQLARGGMAEVFKAKAHGVEGFEKVLVIKRILPELSENPRFVEMFINEAKIAVTLSHANIVQVFDLGMAEGSYFIAMEYVAGFDLAKVLKRLRKAKRTLPPEVAVFIASELAKGLDYAHRRRDSEMRPLNIVHRDVSPQNLLLSFEGEVKLTDFGIAKARTVVQAVTELGVVKGKYAYMSPEQLTGGQLDPRTDIFSAGTLLYEALAGKNPFQAESNYDTLRRIREGTPTPLEEAVPGLPLDIGRIVRRAMATRIEERYQSAGDFYEDLIQYLYSTGRRVSARDVAEQLSALRGSFEAPPELDRFDEVFDATAFDEPAHDRTRVARGRKPAGRPTPPAPEAPAGLPASARERTEWREVTAMVVSLEREEPLADETLARLVERFGGTLASDLALPAADGRRLMTALFGDKNPDGRDAENAARCALKVARASSAAAAAAGSTSSAAIALSSGRVLVDLSGDLRHDPAYEELFERCRELVEQTGEGQILVDEVAERALRERFRLVEAGRQAEGAFLLATERNLSEASGRFIGRRTELRRIGESLAAANRSELQIVGLNGEAGAGKTRLLLETTRRLGLAGHNVGLHVAALTPQMRDVPLSAIQEMLRVVLGVDEFDPEALLRDRTTRLRELGLLSVEQAAVAAALGLQSTGRKRASHRPLKAALLRILRKLAEDRLTIFAFDGAEYMDEDSQGIVEDMLRAVSEAPIGVFLCYRPGHRPRWADLENFVEVQLEPMDDEDVARLVATRLGAEEIPFELLREITTKSGGNPLYVEEFIKALRQSGAVTFEDGQLDYHPEAASVEIPKTLRGIVASRVARLDPIQRYLLQVASLVGERFVAEIVAAAAQEEVSAVTAALESEEMQGIVTMRGPGEHMFAHALVQQVLVEGITLQARREIHTAIAQAISALYPSRIDEMAERLARHFEGAGDDARAVAYLDRAVDRLEAEGALDGAQQELRRAIEILANGGVEDRSALLERYERLASIQFRNRDLVEGAESMGRAIKVAEAARSQRYLARFCMWRGRMLAGASRIEEGRRWLDQAQHVARGLTDWEISRDVFLATADADARSGEFEKAVGFLREALSLSREAGERRAELSCLLPLALTYGRMGDHQSAMATLNDAKEVARVLADPLFNCRVFKLESQIHYHARDQRASARAAGRAMELAQEAGLHYEAALNAHNMGEAFLRLGDHRRAFASLRNSFEAATENGYTRLQMSNMRALGFIDATRFNSSEGRTRVTQAIEYAVEHDFVWDVIQGKYLLAIVDQQLGNHDSSRAELREVLELAAQHGHRNYTEDAENALRLLERGEPIGLPP